jgi:uncharacterized protein with von Willebrand factor type A (vWA) domain
MTELAEIKNNFESKCSIKIETNSKGHNTTVHVYDGVTLQEIDDTVEKAIYAHCHIQQKIERNDSHCVKCGEWNEFGNSICSECGESIHK